MTSILQICDELAARLNDATFAAPFEAKRMILSKYKREDLAELRVTVAPAAAAETLIARKLVDRGDSVMVLIQKLVDDANSDETAELIRLAESVRAWLRERRLTVDTSEAAWTAVITTTEHEIYDIEHLANDTIFTSVILVTFSMSERVTNA